MITRHITNPAAIRTKHPSNVKLSILLIPKEPSNYERREDQHRGQHGMSPRPIAKPRHFVAPMFGATAPLGALQLPSHFDAAGGGVDGSPGLTLADSKNENMM